MDFMLTVKNLLGFVFYALEEAQWKIMVQKKEPASNIYKHAVK